MERLSLLAQLARPNDSKLLFWIFDGLGGLPDPQTGRSELETAHLPHIHAFARRSCCGVHEPCGAGITTGSGFGHLALFGYPIASLSLPRGTLEVLGSDHFYLNGELLKDVSLVPDEIAIRGNFARLEADPETGERLVADRRANHLQSAQNEALCAWLSREIALPGVTLRWYPGKQHRFALTLRGEGLCAGVSDTDPQRSGLAPRDAVALRPEAAHTAALLSEIIERVEALLATREEADTILLRGIGTLPSIPTLRELHGLNAAAIATYPVYKGVARLLGMRVLELEAPTPEAQLDALRRHHHEHDFFFFHVKETDSLAHRGDFQGKVAAFERWDARFAEALALGFDVVVLTGDHCTPSVLAEHSWHPVPTALWSRHVFAGDAERFTERECVRGALGRRAAQDLLPLALAEAGRLATFGP